MKRHFKCMVGLLLCSSLLSACGSSAEIQNSGSAQSSTVGEAAVSSPAPAEAVPLESTGTIGDYTIEIQESTLTKDYNGKPVIVITYSFTNNGTESTSAMVAVHDVAYQNGVQLDTAIVMDSSLVNSDNAMKDIKTGGTIDIQSAYLLLSETAPVEYEIGEFISFSDEKLGKTFETLPGGKTELATIEVPADAATGVIGDYEVSIISCETTKDYNGADAVMITYGFKNTGTSTATFLTSLNAKAYQDSVELESAILADGEIGSTQMKAILPGAAILVKAAYLTASTSPLEVEVSEFMGFSGTKVAHTFTF